MVNTDLCISLNQLDSICVHMTLPDNNIISTNFALWDTILDVKHYILHVLQPKVENIQQIQCFMHCLHQQLEVNNQTALKKIWNKCPIKMFVNIEHPNDIKKISHVSNSKAQTNMIHPKYGNVLDTNATIPWPVMGYKNKKTSKIYRNKTVQTEFKTTDFDCQFNKNKNSLTIQTIQTHDATTGVNVEIGTQTETINILQSLNSMNEISNYHNIQLQKKNLLRIIIFYYLL